EVQRAQWKSRANSICADRPVSDDRAGTRHGDDGCGQRWTSSYFRNKACAWRETPADGSAVSRFSARDSRQTGGRSDDGAALRFLRCAGLGAGRDWTIWSALVLHHAAAERDRYTDCTWCGSRTSGRPSPARYRVDAGYRRRRWNRTCVSGRTDSYYDALRTEAL